MLQGTAVVPEGLFLQAVDFLTAHVQSTDAAKAEPNWLTAEAFSRLSPAQKSTYLRRLADELAEEPAQGGQGTQ